MTSTSMNEPDLKIIRLSHSVGLPLPSYQTSAASGMDLHAACETETPVTLQSGARVLIPTGLIIELPNGYEGQIRPRSGLANKHGITCLNSPGTIDADYRGEVKVLLINHGAEDFKIRRGDRIAQLVIAPVSRVNVITADQPTQSDRGDGGFGSTGR